MGVNGNAAKYSYTKAVRSAADSSWKFNCNLFLAMYRAGVEARASVKKNLTHPRKGEGERPSPWFYYNTGLGKSQIL